MTRSRPGRGWARRLGVRRDRRGPSAVSALPALAAVVLAPLAAPHASSAQDDAPSGIPVRDQTTVDACSRCHAVDDDGLMSRVSWMRKTPEGWQQSIRRMATLNDVELEPETARRIVRYLSDHHGLAPDELAPGRFEVERRLADYAYEADEDVAYTCSRCHSMGRTVTQRRAKEEWELLMAMHRGYYPLSDTQGFRRIGPPAPDAADARHPVEKAVAHLAKEFPLETAAWSEWSATMRPPRLAGTWALRGHDPGRGPVYGTVEIEAGPDAGGFVTTMIVVMLLMFVLGFVLDFIEITFVVVPIIGPVLLAMGADPVWLGVMIAVNLQTSFLTPPFGFSLFYLRGVAPRAVKTRHIYKGVMPFIGLQLLALLALALWPQAATWLPSVLLR